MHPALHGGFLGGTPGAASHALPPQRLQMEFFNRLLTAIVSKRNVVQNSGRPPTSSIFSVDCGFSRERNQRCLRPRKCRITGRQTSKIVIGFIPKSPRTFGVRQSRTRSPGLTSGIAAAPLREPASAHAASLCFAGLSAVVDCVSPCPSPGKPYARRPCATADGPLQRR